MMSYNVIKFDVVLHNYIWSLMSRHFYMNAVGCKWDFQLKCRIDGSIEWHKIWIVVKGFWH